MDTDSLYEGLYTESYRAFSEKIAKDERYPVKGVRIPDLRALAKRADDTSFPIRYHEDVILKGLIILREKAPFSTIISKLEELYPYMSAWDHSDVLASSLKVRKGEEEEVLHYFLALLEDERTFVRRLAIVVLMSSRKLYDRTLLLDAIVKADSAEYYISMAVAWALSFFYIDDRSAEAWFSAVSEETRKRAKQKVKDSRRC